MLEDVADAPPAVLESVNTDEQANEDVVVRRVTLNIPQRIFVIVSCALITLVSSAVYTTNVISGHISDDFGIDANGTQMSLLIAFGLIGMQFTFVGGIVYDNLGALGALAVGAFFTIGGFQATSFANLKLFPLMVLSYTFVGIGQGMTFLAAFATVIRTSASGAGAGVAIVSMCMSLSLSFTIFLTNQYQSTTGCTAPDCWRNYFRLWTLVCAVFYFAGMPAIAWYQLKEYYHRKGPELQRLISQDKAEDEKPTFKEKMGIHIFSHMYFYPLFVSYAVAVGSCVLVLSFATQMWFEFKGDTNKDKWSNGLLLKLFSFANAASNFLSAVVSDFLHRKKILQHRYFVIIVLSTFGINYIILGILNTLRHKIHTDLFAVLIAFNGAGFGVYVTLFPIIIAQIYGNKNFGIYFAWVLLGAGISSVATPPIVSNVQRLAGSFTPMYFGFGAMLLLVVLPLIFVPLRKYKQRGDF